MKLGGLLYLNKSDRQVLLTLLSLAAIVLCAIYLAGGHGDESSGSPAHEDGDSLRQAMSANDTREERRKEGQASFHYAQQGRGVERFPFDPNTADSTTLLRLGLRPWQVRNIYKYRAAGGIYRRKEDFAQLYGLTVKEYRELEPYIRISSDYLPASTLFGKRRAPGVGDGEEGDSLTAQSARLRYPVKIKDGETIDLNIADTADLKTVPGIGSYYAHRIADYGRRLGGYVSVSQLDEIEDLPDEVKHYFVVSQPHPRQLAINRLTLNELKRHPYINYYQARAITDYRRLHGPIASLSALRLLSEFPPEAIARLEPYVSYE